MLADRNPARRGRTASGARPRLQHPVQRGHRAVVHVGRGRPDAVQRPRAIERLLRRRVGIGTVAALAPELLDRRVRDAALSFSHFWLTLSTRIISAIENGMFGRGVGRQFSCTSSARRDRAPAADRGNRELEPAVSASTLACAGSVPMMRDAASGPRSTPSRRSDPVSSACRRPETLVRELRVERGIADRSEVALGADLGVERAALGDALRLDLPAASSGKRCDGHFGEVSPPKLLRRCGRTDRGPRSIASMRTRFSSATRRTEQLLRRMVRRQIDQRGNAERLAGVADQRLLDRGVVLRPPATTARSRSAGN